MVTYALIAINTLVFLFQVSLEPAQGEMFVRVWGMTPRFLVGLVPHAALTVVTSMFLHGDWMHLIANMWSLHIFGDNVEDRLGRLGFIGFYVVCGFGAAVVQTLVDPLSLIPMVGASGAIAGVMAAYLRLFPRARVVTVIIVIVLVFVRELPAVFFIVFWFVLQLLSGIGSLGVPQAGPMTAFFAHIGGFLVGLYLLRRGRGRPQGPRRPGTQPPGFRG